MIQSVKIIQRIDSDKNSRSFYESIDEMFPELSDDVYSTLMQERIKSEINDTMIMLDELDDFLIPFPDERGMNALIFKNDSYAINNELVESSLLKYNPVIENSNQVRNISTPSFSVMPFGTFSDTTTKEKLGTDIVMEGM